MIKIKYDFKISNLIVCTENETFGKVVCNEMRFTKIVIINILLIYM